MKINQILKINIIFFVLVFLTISLLFPNFFILLLSFMKKNNYNIPYFNFTLDNFFIAISNEAFLKIYAHSIIASCITVAFSLLLGYPFAYLIYSQHLKWKKQLLLLSIIVPFWASLLIKTYAVTYILSAKGFINKILLSLGIISQPLHLLYNWGAVIFGFIYTLIPLAIIPIYISLKKIDFKLIEAAEDLGASKYQTFKNIILPLTTHGIFTASCMVFLSSISMFYLSDLLGGSKYILIGNLIKNHFLVTQDWPLGSAISITFYIFTLVYILLQRYLCKKI